VSRKGLSARWNAFFFAPQSPLPIALFRMLYGAMACATLLLLRRDWLVWYGSRGLISPETMSRMEPGIRINIFHLLPSGDPWIEAVFWVLLGSTICLCAGFLTRISSVIVFVGLASLDERNLIITHSGDTFIRVTGFFLMFAPAGACLSVDHLIRVKARKEGPVPRPRAPWAQRLIQFELSLLYFTAAISKALGEPWLSGAALYYIYHLEDLRRFPLPQWFYNPTILALGGWGAMALEFALGTLIWIRALRYYLLAAGLILHLVLEYSLNIPLFQWEVLSAYVLFIDPRDLMRLMARARSFAKNRLVRSPRTTRSLPPATRSQGPSRKTSGYP
jgi:hypothetical protein